MGGGNIQEIKHVVKKGDTLWGMAKKYKIKDWKTIWAYRKNKDHHQTVAKIDQAGTLARAAVKYCDDARKRLTKDYSADFQVAGLGKQYDDWAKAVRKVLTKNEANDKEIADYFKKYKQIEDAYKKNMAASKQNFTNDEEAKIEALVQALKKLGV